NPPRPFHNECCRRLLRSPARDFLPQEFAEFGDSTIGISEVFGHSRLGAAQRFQNHAILFNDLEVLLFPECLIEEAPICAFPPAELPIAEEVDQRAVVRPGRRKAKDSQNSFWTEWKRNIQAYPQRILAIEFRPVEVHTPLAFALDDEAGLI